MSYKPPIRIAYAEDHDVIRQGVRDLLIGLGGCTFPIEASNGAELIQKMADAEQLPDVVLLDIYMPEMDGCQALLEIRKRWPNQKAMVLTGHNTEYYLIKMIRAGANGYLLKSSGPREVLNAIGCIHRTGHYYSDVMSRQFADKVNSGEVSLPALNEKETAILRYCCSDLSYVQIAEKMDISPKSVEHWREGLFKKLKVGSRSGLVMFAVRFGIVEMHTSTLVHPIPDPTS